MAVGMDLIARLESHANSWERNGCVPHDAHVGRDPAAEAALLREAAEGLRMLADMSKDDTIGHTIVGWVANIFEGREQIDFHDGFIAFNDPRKWLASHRAAAAYIADAWRRDREGRGPDKAASAADDTQGGSVE